MEVIKLKLIFFFFYSLLDLAQSSNNSSKLINSNRNNTLIKFPKSNQPSQSPSSSSSNQMDKQDERTLEIEATFPGGCGTSIMAKKRLLDSFQSYLRKSSIAMKYKMRNTLKEPLTSEEASMLKDSGIYFDSGEFNIFLLSSGQKSLIGTSSNVDSLGSLSNPCLQGVLGSDQEKCFKQMLDKIIETRENKKIKN